MQKPNRKLLKIRLPDLDQAATRLRLGGDQAVDKHAILRTCLHPVKMKDLISITGFKHRTNFKKNYINPLVNDGLLALTVPDKPSSPNQRYITTKKGSDVLGQEKGKEEHPMRHP